MGMGAESKSNPSTSYRQGTRRLTMPGLVDPVPMTEIDERVLDGAEALRDGLGVRVRPYSWRHPVPFGSSAAAVQGRTPPPTHSVRSRRGLIRDQWLGDAPTLTRLGITGTLVKW